jgi:hypothetical protein
MFKGEACEDYCDLFKDNNLPGFVSAWQVIVWFTGRNNNETARNHKDPKSFR